LKVRTLLSFGLTARILTLRNDVLTASFFFQQWKKLCSFVPQTQFTRIRCLRGESFINAMTSLLAGDYNAAKEVFAALWFSIAPLGCDFKKTRADLTSICRIWAVG
jgi:hypothetical protein